MKSIIKHYIAINITFIFMALYFINLPMISSIITTYTPIEVTCPFNELTGDDCPYCGITSEIDVLQNSTNETKVSNGISLGTFIYYFCYAEILIRLVLILLQYLKKVPKFIIYVDCLIHSLLLSAFFIYNITFLINYAS